ncbi:MAG: glycosyltransferase family 2 protein [Bacteroidia bacterium]
MHTTWTLIFWIALACVVYTYVGYPLVLFALIRIKRLFGKARQAFNPSYEPDVTLLVAAYNEEDFIEEKIENSLQLDYPKDKLRLLFVTDGSDDATPRLVKGFSQVELMHKPERAGKIAAVQRALPQVDSPVVIFTDANTLLNREAVRNIVRHFADDNVGGVSGEKRIMTDEKAAANGAGEGIYWKYESTIKRWDSEFNTVVGAAGELFAVRTDIHPSVPSDTLIEDFYTTMKITQAGYRVAYEPEAFAMEGPSASVKEELKRKVRIAAGGIQAFVRLRALMNPLRYGWMSFQYISHRVMRWTVAPLSLLLMFLANIALASTGVPFWQGLMILQIAFYASAALGWILEKKQMKIKAFFVPYYFCVMNYAMYRGFFRYLSGRQSVLWERAKRG